MVIFHSYVSLPEGIFSIRAVFWVNINKVDDHGEKGMIVQLLEVITMVIPCCSIH
jgi:hypothetical protein